MPPPWVQGAILTVVHSALQGLPHGRNTRVLGQRPHSINSRRTGAGTFVLALPQPSLLSELHRV